LKIKNKVVKLEYAVWMRLVLGELGWQVGFGGFMEGI